MSPVGEVVGVVMGAFTLITLGALRRVSVFDKRNRTEQNDANALVPYVLVEDGVPCPKCGVRTRLSHEGLSLPSRCDGVGCKLKTDHLHLLCFTCHRALVMRTRDAQLELDKQ
jgi:hypothetical protein